MAENRGRKSLADMITPPSLRRLTPPPHLTPRQREFFIQITQSVAADYFLPSDTPMLAAYCVAVDLYEEACEHINTHGQVLTRENGNLYANPSVGLAKQHATTMMGLASRLRLNPASRITAGSAGGKGSGTAVPPWEADADGDGLGSVPN